MYRQKLLQLPLCLSGPTMLMSTPTPRMSNYQNLQNYQSHQEKNHLDQIPLRYHKLNHRQNDR